MPETTSDVLSGYLLEHFRTKYRTDGPVHPVLNTPCWPWTAGLGRGGYGVFWVPPHQRCAHRLSYELEVGPIPDGLVIDHLCRNRSCINPGHLEPVTHRINLLRGETIQAANARKTHCLRGHPFDEENTDRQSDGYRRCRACKKARSRRRPHL